MRRTLSVAVVMLGCSAERPRAVDLPPQPTSSTAAPIASTLIPPSSRPSAYGNACLMLYECGCNAGCTEIDRAPDTLRVGREARVVSGPLKGTAVFVAKNRTSDGDSVFTVQRADPSAPIMVCGDPRSPLVGYPCSSKDSGGARACKTCE
jgi:hypothetical protein